MLVRGFEGRGLMLRAYDAAARGLQEHPDDLWLKHRAVLALARSGATETAMRRYQEYRLAREDDEEIASLGARLAKDLAWLAAGKERAARAARIVLGTRTRLRVRRWRAASTTGAGQR